MGKIGQNRLNGSNRSNRSKRPKQAKKGKIGKKKVKICPKKSQNRTKQDKIGLIDQNRP